MNNYQVSKTLKHDHCRKAMDEVWKQVSPAVWSWVDVMVWQPVDLLVWSRVYREVRIEVPFA